MKNLAREIGVPFKYKLVYAFFFFMGILTNLVMINDTRQLVTFALAMDLSSFHSTLMNFLCFLGCNLVFTFLDQKWFRTITNQGELSLKKYTMKMYLKNQEYIENVNPAALCSKLNQDVVVLANWISIGKVNRICQFLFLFMYVCAMIGYSFLITIFAVFLMGIVFYLTKKISEKQAVYFSRLKEVQEKISLAIHNDFLNQFTIMQLGIGSYVRKKLREIVDKKAIRRFALYTSLNEATLVFMTQFIPVVILCVGMLVLGKYEGGLGTALSLMLIAQKLNEPVIVIAELYSDQKNAEQVYARIQNLYMAHADELEQKRRIGKFEQLDLSMESYTYSGQRAQSIYPLFRSKINRGEIVVIQGESGCGKSTILKLIARLIDPQGLNGKILYNGMPIDTFCRDNLYERLLLVEQEPAIIEGTLRENLELGDSFSEQEIKWACKQAGLDTVCNDRGLDMMVSENGTNLSGGEKHRVALARMFLRKPDVLLLDEAFTGIEETGRQIIGRNLLKMVKERQATLIAVSHEQDFLETATQIIHVEK